MAKYTIEDIEILRQKSGISYEEAVNLLEYHNGSLARALVDLEKNGRLKSNTASSNSHKGVKGVFDFLFRLRIKVRKEQTTIVNLSSLFLLIVLGTAPHICIIGLIVSIILGYRISVDRDSREFSGDNFDDMVKNARSNVSGIVASDDQSRICFKYRSRAKYPNTVLPANIPAAIAAVPTPACHGVALKLSCKYVAAQNVNVNSAPAPMNIPKQ